MPAGSAFVASTPTPVSGTRSVQTAIQENVLGRGLDRRRKRRLRNFAGYRSAMAYTKTPETTSPVQRPKQMHLEPS